LMGTDLVTGTRLRVMLPEVQIVAYFSEKSIFYRDVGQKVITQEYSCPAFTLVLG
jgi:hypothetical protein